MIKNKNRQIVAKLNAKLKKNKQTIKKLNARFKKTHRPIKVTRGKQTGFLKKQR